MAAITKNRNFFKWPKLLYFKQKVPKFELYKHNESFQQSLVEIGSIVSEENIFS
jgi:hypothetical protein